MNRLRDDRIFLSTRLIAAFVIPFLILAFLILYFFPGLSGERFAWNIQPPMTEVYMGAGYIGGAWLFFNALTGKRWHHVAHGFLPVTAFTSAMLLATIIHWDRFNILHFPFLLWLVLYILTPFVIPWAWWRNRVTDPGIPEPGDLRVPSPARWSMRLLGVILLAFAVVGFLNPAWLISLWPWQLTPLTARVLSGWFSLLGIGGIVISNEDRWSAWRVGLQSIALWHLLVMIGAVVHRSDFKTGLVNWYLVTVLIVLIGMVGLYILMESRRRSHRN